MKSEKQEEQEGLMSALEQAKETVLGRIVRYGTEIALNEIITDRHYMDLFPELDSEVLSALVIYARTYGYDDIELLALRDAMRVAEVVKCPSCKKRKFYVECGIIRCKKCGKELYVSSKFTHRYCKECVGFKIGDCWITKFG